MPSSYDRQLKCERTLGAPISKIWEAWTSEEGVHSFFSKYCKVGSAPDDPYEIYFDMSAELGLRGSEGCRVLRSEPQSRFAFTWNAPPHLAEVRNQQTVVEIRLQKIYEAETKFTFIHSGWGVGAQWDQAFEYFDNAWFKIVIPRLEKALRGQDPWS